MWMVYKVQGAGNGEDIPKLVALDYLKRETQNEREAAMVIIEAIKNEYQISWKDIEKELSTRKDGNWNSPGDVMSLEFLHIYSNYSDV
jgi:hypothetical protein